jgi:hypothetical protein
MPDTPWGMIKARQAASQSQSDFGELQKKVDKALQLLKMEKPDIAQVIEVLEKPIRQTRPDPR